MLTRIDLTFETKMTGVGPGNLTVFRLLGQAVAAGTGHIFAPYIVQEVSQGRGPQPG